MNRIFSHQSLPAPNSEWLIASASTDHQIASSIDRSRILGKPTVHLVLDRWSQMIVGSHVSLEEGFQLGCLLAFENALAEKISFCRNLGIEISDADYPCHHICKTLLLGFAPNEWLSNSLLEFGVHVKLPNSRQLAQTAKIEASLGHDILSLGSCGASDRQLNKVFDLKQFRCLLVQYILHYNNHQKLEPHLIDEQMEQHTDLVPIDLWNWGLHSSSNSLRAAPSEKQRLNLLPKATASITLRGIAFQGLYYTCGTAINEQWFIRARVGVRSKVTLAYDPRCIDVVYLIAANGDEPEVCHLTPQYRPMLGQSWFEARSYLADIKKRTQHAHDELKIAVEEIVYKAIKRKGNLET
ncbi:Mu transposase C-terminal domain-containing protein [Oscillatoria sp. FACHB-1407]|uniref:Mu transposase C-terminal domain-containing protein n=1 Tax=Oscillatoria sp. FACHB-1407 TaxID=2692847 RepID=UPI001685DFBC|nr:Mu transposase C-terminal domain-containing protein [Oscillatoria sp. FACHB-1407]MBD2465912.1 Mu transposase C-terminal domain-containing protein [Oscillatoria sp. FACHB-1407]